MLDLKDIYCKSKMKTKEKSADSEKIMGPKIKKVFTSNKNADIFSDKYSNFSSLCQNKINEKLFFALISTKAKQLIWELILYLFLKQLQIPI